MKVRRKKRFVGTVVSIAGRKSVVVAVTRRVMHPLYKKYIDRTKRYMAHDERLECQVGDTVQIVESRPLSARKRWRVSKVLEKAVGAQADSGGEV